MFFPEFPLYARSAIWYVREKLNTEKVEMQDNSITTLAKILKSIAHPIRLRILCHLVSGPQTVGQIHEQLPTSYANVSQHLQRLQNQGLVISAKQANFVYYAISQPSIKVIVAALRRLYCAEAGETERSIPPQKK